MTPRLDYRQMPRRTSWWVDYLLVVHPRERSEVASCPGERTGWSWGGGDPGHGRQARAFFLWLYKNYISLMYNMYRIRVWCVGTVSKEPHHQGGVV